MRSPRVYLQNLNLSVIVEPHFQRHCKIFGPRAWTSSCFKVGRKMVMLLEEESMKTGEKGFDAQESLSV